MQVQQAIKRESTEKSVDKKIPKTAFDGKIENFEPRIELIQTVT